VGIPDGSVSIAGAGESLGLRDGRIDVAWLSTVLHHLDDQDACARELARVVIPGGFSSSAGSAPTPGGSVG